MKVRSGYSWLCGLVLATASATGWAADTFPNKPLKLVVPFPAGSGTDNAARLLAQNVATANGWQIIIENKPGASGFIGVAEVKRAAPDGYTLFYSGNTTHGANSAMFKSLPYDPVADFAPVIRAGVFPLVLLSAPKLGLNSVADLTALAKKRPGELTFAAGSAGPRVAGENYKFTSGTDVRHVPYKSSPQALTDLIGGHVDFMFLDTVASIPMVKAGTLKALAVTSARRIDSLPDVPTMAESGFPGFEQLNWSALFAPAGTPKPIIDALHKAFAGTIASDAWKKYVADLGGYADMTTPAQTSEWVNSEIRNYKTALQRAGVEPE